MQKLILQLLFILCCSVYFDLSPEGNSIAFDFSIALHDQSSQAPGNAEDQSDSGSNKDTDESEDDDEDTSRISEHWSFSQLSITQKEIHHHQMQIYEDQFQAVNLPPPKA